MRGGSSANGEHKIETRQTIKKEGAQPIRTEWDCLRLGRGKIQRINLSLNAYNARGSKNCKGRIVGHRGGRERRNDSPASLKQEERLLNLRNPRGHKGDNRSAHTPQNLIRPVPSSTSSYQPGTSTARYTNPLRECMTTWGRRHQDPIRLVPSSTIP